MNEDQIPALTVVDVVRGEKSIEVELKSGDKRRITIKAPSILQMGMLLLNDRASVHDELIKVCLPEKLEDIPLESKPWAWLEWLDIESYNNVIHIVSCFAYGASTKKKLTPPMRLAREAFKALSSLTSTPPSSVSASDSATPLNGAVPSSPSSSNASDASKPTTA